MLPALQLKKNKIILYWVLLGTLLSQMQKNEIGTLSHHAQKLGNSR